MQFTVDFLRKNSWTSNWPSGIQDADSCSFNKKDYIYQYFDFFWQGILCYFSFFICFYSKIFTDQIVLVIQYSNVFLLHSQDEYTSPIYWIRNRPSIIFPWIDLFQFYNCVMFTDFIHVQIIMFWLKMLFVWLDCWSSWE